MAHWVLKHKCIPLLFAGLSCAVCISGCSSISESAAGPVDKNFALLQEASGSLAVIEEEKVPLASGAKVLVPTSPGAVSYSEGGATLDASNVAEGYVMIKFQGGAKAKVIIEGSGKASYTYNLRTDGVYEVFPINEGDGTYQIAVYQQVHGDQYALELTQKIPVRLSDPFRPFLYPNQFVNFNAGSQAVLKSNELSRTAQSDLDIVSSVYQYVIGNISYDADKAALVQQKQLSGYVPVVDNVLASKKGICFDYAALMTAMLRSQQIPTRMEMGYVSGNLYHAWISTYITDVGWVNGVISFDGKTWTRMDPTFASSGGANSQYTGDGTQYQTIKKY